MKGQCLDSARFGLCPTDGTDSTKPLRYDSSNELGAWFPTWHIVGVRTFLESAARSREIITFRGESQSRLSPRYERSGRAG